ncbi:MAG TPA: exopolyphosphatase, partial [Candidatus Competibacteraceae bacterium]|nr:exopolyphosphatase [Candidatus Competibacteraceae bacterium]
MSEDGSVDVVAAIDLGSNSFHMIVARLVNGQIQVLDRLREMVQLAAGLDGRNRLDEVGQQRALDCLARFGQRLRHIPAGQVRIVGTNTLRLARNSAEFLAQAEGLLGHRVEVISGQEEARLVYLGVMHSVADVPGQRLVVDIGGGSTELIVGRQFEAVQLTSLKMGCVSMSRACFDDGRITESRLRR